MKEYNSEVSSGDPIMLICEFTIEGPKDRAAKESDAKAKLAALASGEWDGSEPEDEIDDGLSDVLNELLED